MIHLDKLFWLPGWVCIWGVITRQIKSYGKRRPDMGEGCPEHFDWDFIKFTWNFEKLQGSKNKEIVNQSGKPVTWLRSRKEVRNFLEEVRHDIAGRENNTPRL